MSRASKALMVFLVAALGVWGCAQGPAGGSANAERIKGLESKCTKLEDDNKTVTVARDQLRKKLAESEELRGKMQQAVNDHEAAVKERDELRQQIVTRTTERDALQGQFEQLRKAIRGVLSQADAATSATQPVTSASSSTQTSSF